MKKHINEKCQSSSVVKEDEIYMYEQKYQSIIVSAVDKVDYKGSFIYNSKVKRPSIMDKSKKAIVLKLKRPICLTLTYLIAFGIILYYDPVMLEEQANEYERKIAREEGLKEGREEGIKEGIKEVIKKLYSKELSLEEISKLLDISISEVKKYVK